MTDNNHPITPPPELVKQWVSLACEYEGNETWIDLATQAARWGADQELEACCKHLKRSMSPRATVDYLRAARRPKPPSLRTALQRLVEEVLDANQYKPPGVLRAVEDARRALESLPD